MCVTNYKLGSTLFTESQQHFHYFICKRRGKTIRLNVNAPFNFSQLSWPDFNYNSNQLFSKPCILKVCTVHTITNNEHTAKYAKIHEKYDSNTGNNKFLINLRQDLKRQTN